MWIDEDEDSVSIPWQVPGELWPEKLADRIILRYKNGLVGVFEYRGDGLWDRATIDGTLYSYDSNYRFPNTIEEWAWVPSEYVFHTAHQIEEILRTEPPVNAEIYSAELPTPEEEPELVKKWHQPFKRLIGR